LLSTVLGIIGTSVGASASSASSSSTSSSTDGSKQTAAQAASIASAASSTTTMLSKGALIGVLADEPPVVIATDSITISAQRQSASQLGNYSVDAAAPGAPAPQVGLPSGLMSMVFASNLSASPASIDSSFVSYDFNIYAFAENGTGPTSPTLTFSLSSGGASVEVVNLSKPILITIPFNAGARNNRRTCRYWNANTSRYATDGCVVFSFDHNSTTCACTHLTSFSIEAAFVPYVRRGLCFLVPCAVRELFMYVCMCVCVLSDASSSFSFSSSSFSSFLSW
jgi:hypothetical protein